MKNEKEEKEKKKKKKKKSKKNQISLSNTKNFYSIKDTKWSLLDHGRKHPGKSPLSLSNQKDPNFMMWQQFSVPMVTVPENNECPKEGRSKNFWGLPNRK